MINYIGSKYSLSDFILPYCPKNPKYWIEPFGGGFGLFFNLNLKNYVNTEFIYNDINPYNTLLFSKLKEPSFRNFIKSYDVKQNNFIESYSNLESNDDDLKALSWLIILFCGDVKNLMSKTWRGSFKYEIFKSKLDFYKEYFDRINVSNLDYKKIILDYDRDDSFFYLDPPYRGYEEYYTNHNWVDDRHIELRDILLDRKSSWILSYYDFPEMKDWYKDFKMVSKKHNLGTEWLIIKP